MDTLQPRLRDVAGEVDMMLLDGAFIPYRELGLLEPRLKPETLIFAGNAFEQADGYLACMRDAANGFRSLSFPLGKGRGNELTLVKQLFD